MHANTCTPEDIINQMDTQYRLSPYLMLRGSAAYTTAKLAGIYLMKAAKLLKDTNTLASFEDALAAVRGEEFSDQIAEMMGLAKSPDLLLTIQKLAGYTNKLNYDMHELVDPTGRMREDTDKAKVTGVFFNEHQQRLSWLNSLELVAATDSDDGDQETYEEYVKKVDDKRFALSPKEYADLCADAVPFHKKYSAEIAAFLMEFGDDENDFDELPLRTQITIIEKMRGKIPAMKEKALKTVKFTTRSKSERTNEGSKMKGLIDSFDKDFTNMLDSSRYAGLEEFMFAYIPERTASTVKSKGTTRRIIAKQEDKVLDAQRNRKFSANEMDSYEKQLAAEGLASLDDI